MKLDPKYDGLLSIDPSIRACGIAVFDKSKLVHANVLRTMAVVNPVISIEEIADKVLTSWEQTMGVSYAPEVLIVELPQIYSGKQAKGDPNDLIPSAILAGVLWEKLKPKAIMLPQPKQWKGQLTKEVTTNRVMEKLTDRELTNVSDDLMRVPSNLRHNAYDAIALGIWGLERLKKRK